MQRIIPLAIFLFLAIGLPMNELQCQEIEESKGMQRDFEQGTTASDSNEKMATSLTFQEKNAEQAMRYYVDVFENARIIEIHRWDQEGPGEEGTIMQASFELNGMKFLCSDSPPIHNWTFTPAVSIYVECESEEEIERLFSKLSREGEVAMPLNNYGFSHKFGWLVDQFGVSWQLNFPSPD